MLALVTGATGTFFGAQNKPATGFNFGASAGGLGTSAFNTATSQAGGPFGATPTAFGTGTAFGTNTGTGLFATTGTLGVGTGLNTGTLGTSKESGERSFDDRVSTSAGVSPMGVRFSRVPDSVDTTISELNVRPLPRGDEKGTSDYGFPVRQDTRLPDNAGVVLKR